MKKLNSGLNIISLLLLIGIIAGCSGGLLGVSIDERIDSFIADMDAAQTSGDYTQLYVHFHSDTEDRTEMADPDIANTYWGTTPFGSGNDIETY